MDSEKKLFPPFQPFSMSLKQLAATEMGLETGMGMEGLRLVLPFLGVVTWNGSSTSNEIKSLG
jgi:hypothetical protein